MRVWNDIESLSADCRISPRTGWRWLKQGRIRKRSEDGRIIFVLVDEPTDITDTDFTDNVTTDVRDMSVNDTEPISDVSTRRVDRKPFIRPVSGLVQSMRDELEAAKVEFEIEKIEDARAKWQERKDRESKEKAEAERDKRLNELVVEEHGRREAEREAKARAKKQRVKNEIFSSDWVDFLSPQHRGRLIVEMEKALSQVDVEGLPETEVLTIAMGIAEQVKKEAYRERDRINLELQEKQAKEAVGYADTILKAIRLGAGLPES